MNNNLIPMYQSLIWHVTCLVRTPGSASAKIEELKTVPKQSDASGTTTSKEDKQDEAVDQDPATWSTGGEDATSKQRAYSESIAQSSHDEEAIYTWRRATDIVRSCLFIYI